jgi:hypothetical protein
MVDWQRKGNPVGSSDSYSPGVPAVAIAIVLGTRGRRSDSDSYRRPVATVALPWEPYPWSGGAPPYVHVYYAPVMAAARTPPVLMPIRTFVV